ncbi:MAG TPA: transketolase C-terminal domain-containing protein [Candidatus Baltobacteraceae bacterium]|nr:transketolase C-terminal domain-containing protein [Candidatus Baltobacteraceae bacterium]
MARELTYAAAIREATVQSMERDESVYLMGLGATDPKGIFGTTLGLEQRFGSKRVLDMPTAENGMTGVAIGSALVGLKPVMVHQRDDFALLALDQIANSAAKWYSMFNFQRSVPLTIRMIIGRGWGQGPQHSQSLQATLGHFPGLKVVMPVTAPDAKGALISAIFDPNPVIVLEHRWLYAVLGDVPEDRFEIPLGKARTACFGTDVTIVATGYGVLEAQRAAEILASDGISAEVIDLRSIRPLDEEAVVDSVSKTGRLIAVDSGWRTFGVAAEVVALASERAFSSLKAAPIRITAPDTYVPTASALANEYYFSTVDIVNAVCAMFDLPLKTDGECGLDPARAKDVPDASFRGPF